MADVCFELLDSKAEQSCKWWQPLRKWEGTQLCVQEIDVDDAKLTFGWVEDQAMLSQMFKKLT